MFEEPDLSRVDVPPGLHVAADHGVLPDVVEHVPVVRRRRLHLVVPHHLRPGGQAQLGKKRRI